MQLLEWPPELLQVLLFLLPRNDLAQLCLTCRHAYNVCMPILYSHLRFSTRKQVRQLAESVRRRPHLRAVMEQSTRQLTLTNWQQISSAWIAEDMDWLGPCVPRLEKLALYHFYDLPVDLLARFLARIRDFKHLELAYCQLEDAADDHDMPTVRQVTRVDFCWTDFGSEVAAYQIFSFLPGLEHVHLGANRNRVTHANTAAVHALVRCCNKVRDLALSLQQVEQDMLCRAIAAYGSQLEHLSIRCSGPETLHAVAKYATGVKNLIIRAGSTETAAAPFSLSSITTTTTTTTTTTAAARRRRPATQEHVHETTAHEEEPVDQQGSIIRILRHCRDLVRLEMVAWMTQDVPAIVWRAVETVAIRRQQNGPIINSNNNKQSSGLPKTLALNVEELQEIRKLFLDK